MSVTAPRIFESEKQELPERQGSMFSPRPLLITAIYTIGGAGMMVAAVMKKLRFFLIFPGIVMLAAGIVFHNYGMTSTD